MSTTNSPNMSLIIPGVGTEPGPDFAYEYNSNLSLLDQHDHSPGAGIQISPAGIDINTSLPFNNNFATSAAGMTFQAQLSQPSAVGTIYESGNDLYFVDGLGNNVRITASGAVAGTPGSISNLVSPASASYVAVSSTFVWQSNTSIAANMDFGSAILRNITPNSTFGLTLQAPASLSSNYSITLPALPASQKIMTLDNSGIMSAPYTVDNSTITIAANIIGIPASGITATQLATNSVTTAKIAALNVTRPKLEALGQQISASSGSFTGSAGARTGVTNLSVVLTTSGRPVRLELIGDYFGGVGVSSAVQIQFGFNRDATALSASTVINSSPTGTVTIGVPASSLAFLDVVGAGTYTYTCVYQVISTGTTANVTNCQLVAYET